MVIQRDGQIFFIRIIRGCDKKHLCNFVLEQRRQMPVDESLAPIDRQPLALTGNGVGGKLRVIARNQLNDVYMENNGTF